MVINQPPQLDLGNQVKMIAYADDLVIPVGYAILSIQMATALKNIENKATQVGLKFSPSKYEATWYRNNNTDRHLEIAGEEIPWRTIT